MKTRGLTPFPQGWGCPPRARPYLVGPLETLRSQLQLHILAFGEKKNQREEIIAFYNTEPPPSPKTSREGWRGTDPRTPMGPAGRVPFDSVRAEVARRADRGEDTRAVYPASGRTDV